MNSKQYAYAAHFNLTVNAKEIMSSNSPRFSKMPIVVRAFQLVGLIFFFLMLIIPTTYQAARGGVLLFLVVGGLIGYATRGKLHLHKVIFLWLYTTVLTSLFFIFVGLINNEPGAIMVSTVFVVWPIVYVFFIGLVRNPSTLAPFLKVIVCGSIGASVLGVLLVTNSMFGLGLNLEIFLEEQGAALNLNNGVLEYRLFNISTVLYSFSFLAAALVVPRHQSVFRGKWRLAIWVGFGLSAVVLLISGRRAFLLIAALTPLIIYGFSRLIKLQIRVFSTSAKLAILGGLVFAIIAPNLGINFGELYQYFAQGFDFSGQGGLSSSIRAQQFWALLSAWSEHPLIGFGHGAAVISDIRNSDRPWAYELSYVALLFQTGIIGMLVYTSSVVWVFAKGVSIMRRQQESIGYLLPLLVALAGFLIANATNPYLQKFDYLWVIFFPVAVINVFMIRNSK